MDIKGKITSNMIILLVDVWLIMSNSTTPWTVAHQAPLSMGFSRQEYWSGFPFLSPGDLPKPRIKPTFVLSPELTGGFFTTGATWEAYYENSR